MRKVLITGAEGFLGRNLAVHLANREDIQVFLYDQRNTPEQLRQWLAMAGTVFHLAGTNRPKNDDEFEAGNVGLTDLVIRILRESDNNPHLIFSSSIQAALDNSYGVSKRRAEESLARFAGETAARVSIFRLKNIFGKWCRPNYNSVVATFCHNIANDLPIQMSAPLREIQLVYVDDVIQAFIAEMDSPKPRNGMAVDPVSIASQTLTLGDLAGRITFFRTMQKTLCIPDFSLRFNQQLYATYLSYVPPERWNYAPEVRRDERGDLAELLKSEHSGQLFVSRTLPGVTRGNHYHHTKTEKFIVVAGEGLIRFRRIEDDNILEFPVRGEDYRIVEIPPGYTHSITNTGSTVMVTLFWASELFDPDSPDTYFLPVDR